MIERWLYFDDDAPISGGLARFDFAIGEVLLRSIMLRKNDEGGFKIVPPSAFHKAAFVVRPRLWAEIERAAISHYRASGRADPVVVAAG